MTRLELPDRNVDVSISPKLGSSDLFEDFGDPRPRRARCVVRKSIGREETVRHDFAVRLRRRALTEMSEPHRVRRDRAAKHGDCNRYQTNGAGPVSSMLPSSCKFARKRFRKRFADFDAAARQMPAGDIAVFNQKHAARAVDNKRADADRQPSREAPIEMQNTLQDRLKQPANGIKLHVSELRHRIDRPATLAFLRPTSFAQLPMPPSYP